MGYPEPRAASSLPQLRLVLNGIACARVTIDVRHGMGQLWGLSFASGIGPSLTKRIFILKVRELLSAACLDPSLYSGQSFCIGAATSAVQADLEDSTISALGWWSSVAFLVYICMSRTHLAGFTQTHSHSIF